MSNPATDNTEPLFSGPALDVMEEVFFAFTPEGKILQWNRRATEVTGYTDEEIAQMHPVELVPEEEAGRIGQHIATVLETGQTRFESLIRTKDGRTISYEFTGSLLKMEGQTLICGTGRDISERKQAERELAASERRYRSLFEEAQEGIAITTPDGEIKEVNSAAAEIFGYSQEALRSKNTTELYVDPAEQEAAAEELAEKGVLEGRELRLRRADGEEIVCRVSTSIRRTEEGDPVALQTFFRDVTGRKKAQRALKESEEKFRTLAEGALVGIALIQDGTYKYVNPALEEMTGYSRETLLGKSLEFVVHPSDWPHVQRQLEKRIGGAVEEASYEARIQAKTGEIRHVEVAGSRITYQDEPAVIGTIQDITERRRMQQEMLRIQEEERKRLGQELHDSLASQLTGANIKLGLLSDQAEGDIAEAIDDIKALIEESASDVRRLSRGLNPAGLPEGNLRSALEGLAGNTEGASFEFEVDEAAEGASGGGESAVEEPDLQEERATHLYRMAQEAVNNALKYADAQKIEIRLREESGALTLEVEDDGTGFDPSAVEEKGLGLRSLQHRSDLLGAQLTIDSSPGEGTLIRCRLPL